MFKIVECHKLDGKFNGKSFYNPSYVHTTNLDYLFQRKLGNKQRIYIFVFKC